MRHVNMTTSAVPINNLLKVIGKLTEEDLARFSTSCLMVARVDNSLPNLGDYSPVLA